MVITAVDTRGCLLLNDAWFYEVFMLNHSENLKVLIAHVGGPLRQLSITHHSRNFDKHF